VPLTLWTVTNPVAGTAVLVGIGGAFHVARRLAGRATSDGSESSTGDPPVSPPIDTRTDGPSADARR
jgi:hypothetical protein